MQESTIYYTGIYPLCLLQESTIYWHIPSLSTARIDYILYWHIPSLSTAVIDYILAYTLFVYCKNRLYTGIYPPCLTSTKTVQLIRDGEKGGGGGRGYAGGGRRRLYTYRYTVTTRMTSALRWAAMRAILMCQ